MADRRPPTWTGRVVMSHPQHCQFCSKLLPRTANEALGVTDGGLDRFRAPERFKHLCFCKDQRALPHDCLRCGLPTNKAWVHSAEVCVALLLLLTFIKERSEVMETRIMKKAQEKAT